jgi:hypothetical protein
MDLELHTSSRVQDQVCESVPRKKSSQLLINCGKLSSGKKTKDIKSKLFFIKDRIDNGEIRVIDCPAEEMWADILSKLLQRIAF